MKYIITSASIIITYNNTTTIIDQSHKYFDIIKDALTNENSKLDVAYLLNKDYIDRAKELLMRTGGHLLPEEMK